MSDAEREQWTEDRLEALAPHEDDRQEFKSAPYLVDEKGGVTAHFLTSLSKQLGAFANGAGGRLFLGLNDDGSVDGGIPTGLKGGGVRAWLEDVIPGALDPPLQGFNVFEVLPRAPGESRIQPGHAVYVIEIPASGDAPHQSADHRYYLRIAGKSRPMGDVHLRDVLRRTRHPRVDVARITPFGAPEPDDTDPRGPKVLMCFQAFVGNQGAQLARHVGCEILLPRHMVNSEARARILAGGEVQLTQQPGELTFFRYHPTPLFPKQEVLFARVWIALHANNLTAVRRGQAQLGWRIYADDAPFRAGAVPLWNFAGVRRAVRALRKKARPAR